MDEIENRLRETADNCVKAYDAWSKSKKNAEARGALQESLHELRKVSARLEIEMASSERDEITQRQIPIPSHRSARHRGHDSGSSGSNLPDFITEGGNDDDSIGNSVEGSENSQPHNNRPPRTGGSPNRMQHRRPMRPRPAEGGNE